MVKVLVWSVVSYGSETWTLRQDDIRSLEAFEMWIWRRMMKISWTQHASNEQILGMVDESRSLMESLRKRQKKLDWACLKTRLPITEGHRRTVSRKELPEDPVSYTHLTLPTIYSV